MRDLKFAVFALSIISLPVPAVAHEFWIDPVRYVLSTGDRLQANFRVGENFKGATQSYINHRSRRLDVAVGGEIAPVDADMGDRPAVSLRASGDGLTAVVHATSNSTLTYNEFEKFESFVRHKDAEWTIAAHRQAGLPEAGFKEVYSRYAKTLVGVGSAAGADRAFGLLTELVALENPYTGDMQDGIDVLVLYEGAPRSEAQIEVFEQADDMSVRVSTVTTDAAGRATVPVRPGHTYMLDSVVLRRPSAELAATRDAVWESLWANLTFRVPD